MKDENKHTGVVKMFNGQFGFIVSEIGDVYFHRSAIVQEGQIDKGDYVEFNTVPSQIKKDAMQAIEVETIRKGHINAAEVNSMPEYVGEINWFDNNKGFGVISHKSGESFVHVSNIQFKPATIVEGDICVFNVMPSKRYNRKTEAKSVIFLKEYPKIEQIANKLKSEITQLGKIDDETKYRKLLKLITFVKKDTWAVFLSKIEVGEQYRFSMWLDGYFDELGLGTLAEKLLIEVPNSHLSLNTRSQKILGRFNSPSKNPAFHTNVYQKIFARLNPETEQRGVLDIFLTKLGDIDNPQKYEKIKAVLDLKEIPEQVKKDFLALAFSKSDNERKFLLWSDKYVDEVDVETIADKMIGETPNLYSNPFQKYFVRLDTEPLQSQALSIFSNKLGNIDSSQKYEKIKAILGLKELSNQTKKEFLVSILAKSDNERKFSLWSDKYVDEVDVEMIADKMIGETPNLYSNPFQKYFVRLDTEPLQSQALSIFSNKLGNIDSSQKYEKIKAILGLKELSNQTKKEFLVSILAKSDNERKFSLWSDKYVDEVDVEMIADKMIGETPNLYSNPFQKIFTRLNSGSVQSKVVSLFLTKLGSIDNSKKYEKVKAILSAKELSEGTKEEFLILAFAKSDSERKFLLWYEGLVNEFDVRYIIEGIIENKFKRLSYQTLFSRLPENAIKTEIINEVFRRLGNIDDVEKYNEIKKLLELDITDNIVNPEILDAIVQKSSFVNKLRFSKDFNQYFDCDIKSVTEAALDCKERVYEISLLFNYLVESELPGFEKTVWLDDIMVKLGVSEILAFLNQISKVYLIKPVKNKYAGVPLIKLIGVKTPNDITYVNNNLSLFPFEYYTQIRSFYHSILNSGYYRSYSTWQHTKKHTDRILCIEYILKSEKLSDQALLDYYQNTDKIDFIDELESLKSFKELHLVLGAEKKDDLIHTLITSFIGDFQSAMKDFAKSIKEEALLNLFKNIKYLDKEFLDVFLENKLNDLSVSIRLKLWIYDVIEYFDFNQFCFYYFTLNSVERSIFNKKAKALMGATLKQAMLKQREPWDLIESNSENNFDKYSATWRSIWFDEGEIRFCVDTDCNFSKAFAWEFSEEKFNLLFDYISGRRLKNLTIWAKGDFVIKVEGLEELEEVIWKVQIQREVETGVGIGMRGKSVNRIPINMVLRNQCIQLLNQLQLNELEPTRVLEKTINLEKGGFTIDISLLYSIPINKNEIAIIWESLELEKSKATHIFKCSRDEYGEIFSDVALYLQSKSKVRSSLNSNNTEDVEQQKKMRYLCRIDHDNFDFSKWEKSLCEALPELKPLTSNKV